MYLFEHSTKNRKHGKTFFFLISKESVFSSYISEELRVLNVLYVQSVGAGKLCKLERSLFL